MHADQITTKFTVARATMLFVAGIATCLVGMSLIFATSARLIFSGSETAMFMALFAGMVLLFRGIVSVFRGGSGMVLLVLGDTA